MLRQQYHSLLKHFLSREIRKYRTQYQMTQEQISERLCMAPRSYADLEHGTCGCSGLTVMLFLLQLEDKEVLQLLDSARKELKEVDRHDAA